MSGNTILVVLLVAAMVATVVALVRGIIAFLQESHAEARGQGTGPTDAQLKSNRMMQARIFFQALAVIVVVVMLVLAGKNG